MGYVRLTIGIAVWLQGREICVTVRTCFVLDMKVCKKSLGQIQMAIEDVSLIVAAGSISGCKLHQNMKAEE